MFETRGTEQRVRLKIIFLRYNIQTFMISLFTIAVENRVREKRKKMQ